MIGGEESTDCVPTNQEVERRFPSPQIKDFIDPYVPQDRIIEWEYDEEVDDDPKIKACDEFLVDDSFVYTKEFKEFFIESRSQKIK